MAAQQGSLTPYARTVLSSLPPASMYRSMAGLRSGISSLAGMMMPIVSRMLFLTRSVIGAGSSSYPVSEMKRETMAVTSSGSGSSGLPILVLPSSRGLSG